MRTFSTIDFAIADEQDLMAFYYVIGRIILKQKDNKFFNVFRKLKFKMKLGYECFERGFKLSTLFRKAIEKTLDESEALAISNLQKHFLMSDGAPDYLSQGRSPDSQSEEEKKETKEEYDLKQCKKKERLAMYFREIEEGLECKDLQAYYNKYRQDKTGSYGASILWYRDVRESKLKFEVVHLKRNDRVSFADFIRMKKQRLPASIKFYINLAMKEKGLTAKGEITELMHEEQKATILKQKIEYYISFFNQSDALDLNKDSNLIEKERLKSDFIGEHFLMLHKSWRLKQKLFRLLK